MKLKIDDVRTRFIKHLGGEPGSVYASPGRINLIGEHTDYNGGFVFPGAVEQGMPNFPSTTRKDPMQAISDMFLVSLAK